MRARSPGPFAAAVIAAASLGMLVWSWGTWPDVLTDFGRELYVPWQLAAGRSLYTDIAYFNGPLSPYVNALWFRAFGVGLRTLVLCNLALLGLTLWLLHDLLARLGDRTAATVASLVFVAVFAFGQLTTTGNYNYVCPYSHELTHGMLLSLTAIWLLARYQMRPLPVAVGGCGLALGLVFLTKPELFVAAGSAVALGLALTLLDERPAPRRLAGVGAAFLAALVSPAVLTALLLSRTMAVGRAARATAGAWPWVLQGDVASLRFYRLGMGTLDWRASLVTMLAWTALHLAILVAVTGLGLLGRTPRGRRLARALVLPASAAVVLAALAVRPDDWMHAPSPGVLSWFYAATPLPVAMVAAGAANLFTLLRQRRRGTDTAHTRLRLVMILFALVLLAKIVLYARVYHYGFVLAMPATLITVVALVDWLPGLVGSWGGDARLSRAAGLALVVAGAVVSLRVTGFWLTQKTTSVGTGPDTFLADARGPMVAAMLEAIARRVPPGATLTALPEGAMLNYLARRPAGIPYVDFTLPALTMFGEDATVAALAAHPPDYIALVHRDPSEYGFFGRDYAQHVYVWFRDRYRPAILLGAPPLKGERFGMALLERAE